MESSAFRNRWLSRFKCSLNALDSGCRGLPWMGVCGSIGGLRINFDKLATLVESRILWIGLETVFEEAIAARYRVQAPGTKIASDSGLNDVGRVWKEKAGVDGKLNGGGFFDWAAVVLALPALRVVLSPTPYSVAQQ